MWCSGQLYAINMQYGVGGAKTNTSANLLVFSFNTSVTPRAADFSVQLSGTTQPGNVSVLSTYSTSSDYLVRVRFGLLLFVSNIIVAHLLFKQCPSPLSHLCSA